MENEIIFTELQLHGKLVGGGNQGFDGDAEFTVQDRSRRGSTEVIAADGLASVLGQPKVEPASTETVLECMAAGKMDSL